MSEPLSLWVADILTTATQPTLKTSLPRRTPLPPARGWARSPPSCHRRLQTSSRCRPEAGLGTLRSGPRGPVQAPWEERVWTALTSRACPSSCCPALLPRRPPSKDKRMAPSVPHRRPSCTRAPARTCGRGTVSFRSSAGSPPVAPSPHLLSLLLELCRPLPSTCCAKSPLGRGRHRGCRAGLHSVTPSSNVTRCRANIRQWLGWGCLRPGA